MNRGSAPIASPAFLRCAPTASSSQPNAPKLSTSKMSKAFGVFLDPRRASESPSTSSGRAECGIVWRGRALGGATGAWGVPAEAGRRNPRPLVICSGRS
ncbi:hypothetical protein C8Q77DRAFT_1115574, partial [Trametes polyzona]